MDRDLVLRAQDGDTEAYELIVLQRGEHLYRTALAILGRDADARDATQEALINGWLRLSDLRPHGFTAQRDGEGVVLYWPDGRLLAREGDYITFAGGTGNEGMFRACGMFEVTPQP